MESPDEVTQTPQDEDPFAEVPAELPPEEEPLPDGIEPGSLGGMNPSEETPPEAEYEPEEQPEEGEPLPPAEEVPADETPVEPEEPEVPAAEIEQSPEPEDAEQPEVPEEPDPEPEADPPTEVETSGEGQEEPTPPADSGEGEEKPEEEEKPPPKKGRSRKRKTRAPDDNTKKAGDRGYVIQVQTKGGKSPQFEEAFAREKPDEPYVLWARNGILAIRRAYHLLSGDADAKDYVLLALPAAYYSPKKVEGRKVSQTAITVS
jgi:hypothetical protein